MPLSPLPTDPPLTGKDREPVIRPRPYRANGAEEHNCLELDFRFAAARYMGRILAASLGDLGHYVSFGFYIPTTDPTDLAGDLDDRIEVTVQRIGRGAKTPIEYRRSAESELRRAMDVLGAHGIPFETAHDFGPGPGEHRDDALYGEAYNTGVVINHNSTPHKLVCNTCGAEQNFPEEWTYPVFHAIVSAFAAEHEYGVCEGGTKEQWEATYPRHSACDCYDDGVGSVLGTNCTQHRSK